MAFIEDFLATHEALIKSTEVLTLAVKYRERVPLEKPPPGRDYVGYISSGLLVSREKTGDGTSANILNISFRGPNPIDSEIVVNAVIEGYRDSLDGGVRNVTKGEPRTNSACARSDRKRKDPSNRSNGNKSSLMPLFGWIPFGGARTPKQYLGRKRLPPVGIVDLKSRINLNEVKRGDLALREIESNNRLKQVTDAKREGKDGRALILLFQRPGDGRMRPAGRPANTRRPIGGIRVQETRAAAVIGQGSSASHCLAPPY